MDNFFKSSAMKRITVRTPTATCMNFKIILGGGFKYFLFSSLFGEDFQFDEHIFSDWLKPPTRK